MPLKKWPRLDAGALEEQGALAARRAAWARWLRTFRWSYFATPTFRHPVSEHAARRAVAAWLDALGPRVYAAVTVERGRVEGRLHAHVLLGGLSRRPGAEVALQRSWPRGRLAVAPYRGSGGAARYLCKNDPDAVDLLGTPKLYRPRRR